MTDPSQPSICCIRSTLDDQGRAACLMEWGPITTLLTPAVVQSTARDLMAAAVRAETDIALIETFREDLQLPDQALVQMLASVRSRRPLPSTPSALRIEAVAGAQTGQPFVHIARGSQTGQLSPDEARDMALHWIEASTAAAIDVRLRYALGEWDHLDITQIEELFTLIQQTGNRG